MYTLAKKRISITIVPFLDEKLENMAKRLGKSKSSIIEQAVKSFLKTQLDTDSRALAKLKFADLPSEDEWIAIQSIPLRF